MGLYEKDDLGVAMLRLRAGDTHRKANLLFSERELRLAGVSHSVCSYSLYRSELAMFQVRPPEYLSEKEVSFLPHFLAKLYSLPGSDEPPQSCGPIGKGRPCW